MLYSILIFELTLLVVIIYKYGIISPVSLGYIVFFIYGQSFLIDYILFDISILNISGFQNLHINSLSYEYITLTYLLFFLGFSFFPLLSKKIRYVKIEEKYFYTNIFKDNLVLIACIVFLVIYLYTTKDFSRYSKIDWLQSHKLITFILNICGYIWIIIILRKQDSCKLTYLFTILFISLAFFDGGRELIVFFVLSILFLKFERTNSFYIILIGILLLVLMLIWKKFFVFIILGGFNITLFFDSVSNQLISFSNSDPKASLFLISSYFNSSHNEFYQNFGFTYIENVVGQFLRTFKIIEYPSLGEKTANYFLNIDEKGKGLAFSGILESMLNFYYAGPFILGLTLGFLTRKIVDLKLVDSYKYRVLSLFMIIVIFKLVRTELAVVLKVYILPMLIAYYFIFKNSYKLNEK